MARAGLPVIPYPVVHPLLDEEEPKKPSGLSFACIMNRNGNTFCHRQPDSKEFTFSREGAEHAIEFYDPRTMKITKHRLTACIACIDEAKERIEKEKIGMVNR